MRPTEPFRKEHEQLLDHIEHIAKAAREMPRLSDDERRAMRERILGFPDAAAPMIHDHEAIVERIDRLAGADIHDVDALQEHLYGLHALISVHFRKEEDLQLPAFDAAPLEITKAVIERMETATGHAHQHPH